MPDGSKKYTWQNIHISPDRTSEILDQMEFLHTLLDCDPHGLVTDPEEQQAIQKELGRLNRMLPAAFDEEISERLETAKKLSSQHTVHTRHRFHQGCRLFCPHLWLMFILVLISFPVFSLLSDDFPWMLPMWFIMFLLSLAWAIWASCPLKE